jgi:glycosyltransferase involved in cell wall biosynthesis
MLVSVEIPVFKHHFLKQAIESVIKQTYKEWVLLLLSDGASEEAQKLLREYDKKEYNGGKARIESHFQDNQGIGNTRNKLSSLSRSDFILPLDHDDILYPGAIEAMVQCHLENPDAGIVRAKRVFIDENSNYFKEDEWFPFAPRNFFKGMTSDVHNHSQPYMIRRTAYEKTAGWQGFPEFKGAGADCDIFLKIEEVAPIVLLDKVLYGYRINPHRFSLELGVKSAQKMWCSLSDITIKRRNLPLKRLNDLPPFNYEVINQNE